MKKLFTVLLAFLVLSSIFVFPQATTGNFNVTYNDRGIVSTMYFWVPADYDSTKSYPFVMAWHGAGDTGGNMRGFMTSRLAQQVDAILVCPDANKINGQDGTYFGNLTSAAYDHTMKNYNIDTNKIVIMGFSWGGAFAYQIGLLNPAYFKGIIGLAPAIGSLDATMWGNIKKIRMATILGDKDFNYAPVSALMNNIKNQGADLLFIVKPGVSHVDNAYFSSQAIIDDFRACYDFVINSSPSDITENDLPENDDVNVYPNPAADFIAIQNPEGIIYDRIIIYSSEGIELLNSGYNRILDIREFANGMYYVKLQSREKTAIKKLIILK